MLFRSKKRKITLVFRFMKISYPVVFFFLIFTHPGANNVINKFLQLESVCSIFCICGVTEEFMRIYFLYLRKQKQWRIRKEWKKNAILVGGAGIGVRLSLGFSDLEKSVLRNIHNRPIFCNTAEKTAPRTKTLRLTMNKSPLIIIIFQDLSFSEPWVCSQYTISQ